MTTESRDRSVLDELRANRERILHPYLRTDPAPIVLRPITIEPMPEEMPFEERLRRTYAYARANGPVVVMPRATIHPIASDRRAAGPPTPARSEAAAGPDGGVDDGEAPGREPTGLASLLLAIALAVVAIVWEMRQPDPPERHRANERCTMVELGSQGTFERTC